MGAIACNDFFDGQVPGACQAPGDYPAGTRCIAADQCQSCFCDLSVPSGGCGQCAAPARRRPADCSPGGFCGRGLLCSVDLTCAVPGELDAECDDSKPCRLTLACNGGSAARRGGGRPLLFPRRLQRGRRRVCNANTSSVSTYRVGTPCAVAQDGTLNACTASGFCRRETGACVAAAADGAVCDDTVGPLCMSPATCVGRDLPAAALRRLLRAHGAAARRRRAGAPPPPSLRPRAFLATAAGERRGGGRR